MILVDTKQQRWRCGASTRTVSYNFVDKQSAQITHLQHYFGEFIYSAARGQSYVDSDRTGLFIYSRPSARRRKQQEIVTRKSNVTRADSDAGRKKERGGLGPFGEAWDKLNGWSGQCGRGGTATHPSAPECNILLLHLINCTRAITINKDCRHLHVLLCVHHSTGGD
jgi:hypothetical protein